MSYNIWRIQLHLESPFLTENIDLNKDDIKMCC